MPYELIDQSNTALQAHITEDTYRLLPVETQALYNLVDGYLDDRHTSLNYNDGLSPYTPGSDHHTPDALNI